MNRFRASTPEDRRALFRAAIEAHRERDSAFLTLEAAPDDDRAGPPPWIQYRAVDETLNLDCTEDELEAVQALIADIGGATVTARESVEDGGVNLNITVRGDDERLAAIFERLFVDGFDLDASVQVWAAAV
jgi:hypothetical protein